MKVSVRSLFLSMGVLALILGTVAPSDAIPTLKLSDGATSVVLADGGVGDISTVDGVVGFSGSVGSWIVNVTTGITKPVLGSALSPELDLNSVNVKASGGGTLSIWFSETDFTQNSWLGLQVGGVLSAPTGSSVSFASYLDDGNAIFGTSAPLNSLTFGPGAFSGTVSNFAPATDPYSVTLKAVFDFTGLSSAGVGSASFNANVAVPEPTTLLLLGTGLIGIGLFRRMRKS